MIIHLPFLGLYPGRVSRSDDMKDRGRGRDPRLHHVIYKHTVWLRSLDPSYIVTILHQMGQDFLNRQYKKCY